jgi:tetratricopeptide (TPR) repeat protein
VVDHELIHYAELALAETADQRTRERVRLLSRACGTYYYSNRRDRMDPLSLEAMRVARELGDREAIAYAYAARRAALWDPTHMRERLEASTSMLTAARAAAEPELQLQAHAWLVVDLMENGDRDGAEAQIDTFNHGAEALRQPLFRWQSMVWRGMLALLDGSLVGAEDAAIEALAAGAPGETITAPQYYLMQMLNVRREQGRSGELEANLQDLALAHPGRPGWRMAGALVLWETGRADEARAALEKLAERNFEDIPGDGEWIPTVAMLAHLATLVGDRERAGMLYDLLRPYEANNIVRGIGAVCLGPTTRYLGRISSTLGRKQEARRHFQAALEATTSLRAPVLRAHTQLDLAESLGAGVQATRLANDAARTAHELDLTALGRRAARLR